MIDDIRHYAQSEPNTISTESAGLAAIEEMARLIQRLEPRLMGADAQLVAALTLMPDARRALIQETTEIVIGVRDKLRAEKEPPHDG